MSEKVTTSSSSLARLAANASRNRDSSTIVRVKAAFDSNFYERPDNWDLLTMRDWQFLEPGGESWSSWNLDHYSIAAVVLSKAGRDSIPPLVACVIEEKMNGDELVDAAGRTAALSGLALMDKKDRERAYSTTKKGYNKLNSENATNWPEMLGARLGTAAK